MVVKLAESDLKTKFGHYREYLFYDGQKEYVVMVLGEVAGATDVLCRAHSSCIYGHSFNSIECDCREQMEIAQRMIEKAGQGIIFWLDQEGKNNGHLALMQSKIFKREGMSQAEAYEAAGFKKDARDFDRVAEILKIIGVASVRLLSESPKKAESLRQLGIEVSGFEALRWEG